MVSELILYGCVSALKNFHFERELRTDGKSTNETKYVLLHRPELIMFLVIQYHSG